MDDSREATIVISADTDSYTSSVNESYEATNKLNSALEKTNASLDGLVKRAGKKLSLFGMSDLAALGSAVTVAATLDKQMTSLNATAAVLGKTTKQTFANDMRDGIRSISREIPIARGEIVQLASTIGKMGQTSASTITTLTRDFAKFGAATGESPTALAQSQLGLSRTMGTFTGTYPNNRPGVVNNFNDATTKLSARGGVSAQSIIDFSQMLAPTARMADISQTDLLGISTAFNRSGADGSYAANTFNQIVSDVLQKRISGDPSLKTYQNQLGISNKQLKTMSPVDIFSQLVSTVSGQGQRGITTLNALGVDGMRAQKSITALSAEGNIDKYINIARKSYGDNSVEKGSQAAFSGLFDSIEKVKNNMTDLAQQIGQTLLPVVNKMAGMFASTVQTIATVAQPISKLLGPVAAGGGGAALAGAGMLGLWSMMGPVAMGRWALKTRPGLGFKEGIKYGRAGGNIIDMPADTARYAAAIANDQVGPVSRMAFGMGGALGTAREKLGGGPGQWFRQGVAGVGAISRTFMDQTRNFYNQSTAASGYGKLAPDGGYRGFGSSFMGAFRGGVADTVFGSVPSKSDFTKATPTAGIWSQVRANMDNAKTAGTFKILSAEALKTAGALAKIPVAATRAAGSLAGSGLGLAARGAGKGIASAASGLYGLVGNGPGAALLAAGAGAYVYSKSRNEKDPWKESGVLSGLTAYDEQLGVSTKALTSFTDAINGATAATAHPKTYKDVLKDQTASDEAKKNKDIVDDKAKAVSTTEQATQWMLSEGESLSPEKLREIKIDLFRRKQQDPNLDLNVDKAIREYLKQRRSGNIGAFAPPPDPLDHLQTKDGGSWFDKSKRGISNWIDQTADKFPAWMRTNLVDQVTGGDWKNNFARNSANTTELQGSAMTTMDYFNNKKSTLLEEYGGTKKDIRAINRGMRGEFASVIADLLKEGSTESVEKAKLLIADSASRNKKEWGTTGQTDLSKFDFNNMSDEEVMKTIINEHIVGDLDMNDIHQFTKDAISSLLGDKSELSLSTKSFLNNKDFKDLEGFSGYAKATGESKLLGRAEVRSNDPNLNWRAVQELQKQANASTGGDLQQNNKLYNATISQYVDGPRAQWAQAAMQMNQGRIQYERQFTNTPSQVSGAITDWQTLMDKSANSKPGIGEERYKAAENAKQAIADLYKTLQQYNRQMKREEEDFYQNRAWSMEDFYRQRKQSTAAYHRQMMYSEQEYNISRKRSQEDYQRGVNRSTRDYNRSMRREEVDYNRQRKWSADDFYRQRAYSIEDYNRQQKIQYREFNIAMTRSNNDYQRSITRSNFDFNKSRVRSDEDYQLSVTRSTYDFNKSRVRSIDDYQLSVSRSVFDFNKSQSRSNADYQLSLKRSEFDFNKSRMRSNEDYVLSVTRSTFDFHKSQKRSTDDYQLSITRSQQDFNKSRARSDYDYQLSMERSSFDFNKSRKRSQRDFNISMTRASEDFSRQQQYSIEDYQKSVQRSQEDFLLSRSRSVTDYNKSMARESEDHFLQLTRMSKDAAKSFYDPWMRVQSQATAGVDTFLENLRDQTDRIKRQFENLDKLKKRGLSQDAIDMYGLSDPNKAQQLQRISTEITDKQIADLNKLTKAREGGAKELTQSDFNESFRRMEEDRKKSLARSAEDFAISLQRSSDDYQKAMKRSEEDFQKSLKRSVEAFNLSQSRAIEDFMRGMADSEEDFNLSMQRSNEDYAKSLERASEDFALSLQRSDEDFNKSLARAIEDFNTSMSRSNDDYQKSLSRSYEDFQTSLQRSNEDYAKSMARSVEDFITSMTRSKEDFEKSLKRSTEDFQLSMERSGEDYAKSLKRSYEDYALSLARSDEDFRRSQRNAVEDFRRNLNDSNESFNISLDRSAKEFKRSMDRQDKLRSQQLNRSNRDWNRSLLQQERDYNRSLRRMAADRNRQVANSDKEFRISMNIANENFNRSINRMDISRNKQLNRAKQDLIGMGKDMFTSYDDIVNKMSGLLKKHMGSAGDSLINKLQNVKTRLFDFGKASGKSFKDSYTSYMDAIMKQLTKSTDKALALATKLKFKLSSASGSVNVGPGNPDGQGGSGGGGGGAWAIGGIATGRVDGATVGEGGPELILPLNSRGMDYLTTALRAYAQTESTRMKSSPNIWGSDNRESSSITQFNFGDVSVASDTPDQFYKEMKQKESLKKLAGHS